MEMMLFQQMVSGQDFIIAGNGNDTIDSVTVAIWSLTAMVTTRFLEGEAKTSFGNDGNDTIDGGQGADFIFGGSGSNVITEDLRVTGYIIVLGVIFSILMQLKNHMYQEGLM